MKTVVITGSARGFGLAMLRFFKEKNFNVVVCDISQDDLVKAKEELDSIKSKSKVLAFLCDVTKDSDVKNVITKTLEEVKTIDIWINNAGVNQPNAPIWNLDTKVIDRLIDIDLKGTIICSKEIIPIMQKQGFGAIYNVEGHGSNDAKILGLSLYGTSKRGVTYFTESLGFEIDKLNLPILIGKITPGIMITHFISNSVDNKPIELDPKTKNIYNILGDYPETIAEFMVNKIINNTKNNVKFTWLTNRRAFMRFLTASFKKRNFFE